jgi:hypothetical protein
MELHALLVIEFDASVDKISREMFFERLAQFEWQRDAKVASAWMLYFEERSTREGALRSVNNSLDLACERGRIKRDQIRALVQFGPGAPIQV